MATTRVQAGYRFRWDDDSETAANWIDDINVSVTRIVPYLNQKLRLRINVRQTGTTAAAITERLYVSKNGGAYAQILSSGNLGVITVASANLTDNAATTQQISDGTFVAGKVDDVNGQCGVTASMAQNVDTEHEYMLQINYADVADGDYFEFKAYNTTSAIDTYTEIPRLTIIKNAEVDDNKIYDGDFELATAAQTITASGSLEAGIPNEWWVWIENTGLAEFNFTKQASGNACLHLQLGSASAYIECKNITGDYYAKEGISMLPNTYYRFSIKIKTENVTGETDTGAFVQILFSDVNGIDTVGNSLNGEFDASEFTLTDYVKSNQGWTTYTGIIHTGANTVWAHAECRIYGHEGVGTLQGDFYFDDMRLEFASTETDIISFDFTSPAATGTVNNTNHTVALTVPYGTDVTSLTPTIAVSAGATISPTSGTATDFTSPVDYTVTAEDTTTTQVYAVTVTVEEATPISVTDSAAGSDSLSIVVTLDVADSGAGTDTVSEQIAVPVSDSGNGSETISESSIIPITDSGSGSETILERSTVPVIDSGAGTEIITETSTVPISDSGSGAETIAERSTVPVADNGAGSETVLESAAVPVSDSGAGSENIIESSAVPVSDSGSGTEAIVNHATIPVNDSGVGNETTIISAVIPVTDSGSFSDIISSILTSFSLQDSGAGSDNIVVATNTFTISVTDSGAGTDGIDTYKTATIQITENPVGTDSLNISATVTLQDSGNANEVIAIAAAILMADSGNATEILQYLVAAALSDNGSGTENIGIHTTLAVNDSVSGSDNVLTTASAYITDNFSESDAVAILSAVGVSDAAIGEEILYILTSKIINDSGSGADSITEIHKYSPGDLYKKLSSLYSKSSSKYTRRKNYHKP